MDKPNTSLHEANYCEHWKVWVDWYVQENHFTSLEEAVKVLMKETKGLVNPTFISDSLSNKLPKRS